MRVPRYNKSLHCGRGDRETIDNWTIVEEQPDVVILEGWMLGFSPLADKTIEEIEAHEVGIADVNSNLKEYKAVHENVDVWIVLTVEDAEMVRDWRLEAEQRMRKSGKPAMTDKEVDEFVSMYMPAYRTYLANLYEDGPDSMPSHVPLLKIPVNRSRFPTDPDALKNDVRSD